LRERDRFNPKVKAETRADLFRGFRALLTDKEAKRQRCSSKMPEFREFSLRRLFSVSVCAKSFLRAVSDV